MPKLEPASPWPFVGMAALACTFFLYAASALVAPWWAVVLLLLVWVGFLVVGCAWWSSRPKGIVVLAVVSAVVWFAAVIAGARWLGWS